MPNGGDVFGLFLGCCRARHHNQLVSQSHGKCSVNLNATSSKPPGEGGVHSSRLSVQNNGSFFNTRHRRLVRVKFACARYAMGCEADCCRAHPGLIKSCKMLPVFLLFVIGFAHQSVRVFLFPTYQMDGTPLAVFASFCHSPTGLTLVQSQESLTALGLSHHGESIDSVSLDSNVRHMKAPIQTIFYLVATSKCA